MFNPLASPSVSYEKPRMPASPTNGLDGAIGVSGSNAEIRREQCERFGIPVTEWATPIQLTPQYTPVVPPQPTVDDVVNHIQQRIISTPQREQSLANPSSLTVPSGMELFQSSPPHIIVEAYAGTGKTFTIMEACYRMCGIRRPNIVGSDEQETIWSAMTEQYNPRSIYMVAFNKNVANTLKSQVPPNVQAHTCHGFGKQILGVNRIGTGKYGVFRQKYGKTFNILAAMHNSDVKALFRQFRGPKLFAIAQLVSLLKVNLVVMPTDWSSQVNLLKDLVITHGITMPEFKNEADEQFVYGHAIAVYEKHKEFTNRIDFDDMIWMPWALNLDIRPYEVMFVDERQDLNLAQQELVCRGAKRLIMVGDSNQAIYGFAGADVSACDRMEDRLSSSPRKCKTFPLTFTRRCSKAVVRFNQSIVKAFRHFNENPEGAIYQDKESTFLPKVQLGDMVVCRTNAPLFVCCLQLLRVGTPFKTTIKAFFEEIIHLIESFDAKNLVDLMAHLEEWKERKLEQCVGPKADYAVIVNDQVAAIKVAIHNSSSVQGLIGLIESCFKVKRSTGYEDNDDDSDRNVTVDPRWIFLTSIHQAKGLEANRVWWLQHDLVPHPKAKLIEQEINLRWVAGTRAISDLVLVDSTKKEKRSLGEELDDE